LGKEFVKEISNKYHTLDEIWVIARREERLIALQNEITTKLVPIEMDLSDIDELDRFRLRLKEKKPKVLFLVNCAGYGKIGNFLEVPYEDEIGMVQLNCLSLTAATYAVLPYMVKNSRIIQLSSSAAFLPQPRFAVYAATKSYVLSFSRALGRELKSKSISVTAVCPGPVKTEFFDIAEETGKISLYKKLVMADANKVVKKALKDSALGKSMSVYGANMKGLHLLSKILPHELVLKFFPSQER
ncbi:MAG: SDR family NAD(P)-dependent oxidoreductase, partial [Clostridiales bacterium]|nr:SDR family NAD(P)-dependent oxidoreductase [Clostridiales bacterium]